MTSCERLAYDGAGLTEGGREMTLRAIDQDEEARKEELRRFVREKWRRIRELESQTSPSNSSIASEQELGPSKARRDGRHKSVAIEYDPENPFDEERVSTKTIKKVQVKGRLDRIAGRDTHKSIGESSLHNGKATSARPPLRPIEPKVASSSTKTAQTSHTRKANAPRKSMKVMGHSHSDSSLGSRSVAREDPSAATMEAIFVSSEHEAPSKTVKKAIEDGGVSEQDIASMSKGIDKIAISPRSPQVDDGSKETRADDDTPTRRRKRRSEVAHYQPSASPLSLSVETSHALAELEANLARLKAHGSRSSISKVEKRRLSDIRHTAEDEPRRVSSTTRRSLSPSKELRRLEMTQQEEDLSPKISFLTRVTRAKEEAEFKSSASKLQFSTIDVECKSKEGQQCSQMSLQAGMRKGKQRSRSSYTPTQRASLSNNGGGGDDSSCSIVIDDQIIDEAILQQQSKDRARSTTFLRGVRVLVDVRDQDGENASTGWIEKLRSVGAKVYTRIPINDSSKEGANANGKVQKKLTHIVFKNGRPATTQYLRSLSSTNDGEAPIVVGVNWVLQCLQQGGKVDERDFLVEIGKQAIFNKVSQGLYQGAVW